MKRDVKRFFAVFAACILCLAIALSAAWWFGLRYNGTKSYPVGLWRLSARQAHKGDLVFFRPPDDNPVIQWGREVGILHWRFDGSTTMLKRIVAVAGDRIDIGDVVSVNGVPIKNSRVYLRDPAGRKIPSIAHAGVVPNGKVWLMSDYALQSFDSRYFGAVDESVILGVAHPVFTW